MAWMLEARASETCAVRSVSCPRAFSGVADVGFAGESGVFVGVRGAGDSGRSGEGSVVRLIILWILSRVRVLVIWEWLCGFWDETAAGLPGGFKMNEAKKAREQNLLAKTLSARGVVRASLSVVGARWRHTNATHRRVAVGFVP